LTTWAAVLFMITSISLTILIQRNTGPRSVLENIKTTHTRPVPKPAK
jgi:preprotein translocase subunit SecG